MSSLHIINSPIAQSQLTAILATLSHEDDILLIQDACYLLKSPQTSQLLQTHKASYYALQNDIQARNSTNDSVTAISYEQFVELTLTHKNTISW